MSTRSFALLLLAGGTAASALAQGLADPTRPPAGVEQAQPAPVAAAAGLQTLIRREGARPAAVINGTYVELGGQVGDARLVAIDDHSVTLQGPGGREVLYLTPGIEKRPAAPATGKSGGPAKSR